MKELHGLIPPLPTPFSQAGRFSAEDQKTLIAALEPEVDGFLILGSNGEASYLSEAERSEVLESARAVIPEHKAMLAGTGGEATEHVIERCQVAATIGADYALVLPPHYYLSLMSERLLLTHFQRIADKSPIPLLLYNVPANTSLSLSPSLVAQLASHPNIRGLKDSSGNIMALTEIMRQVPEAFIVLTGNAPTLLAALALGARGGILAVGNVAAAAYKKILSAFAAGDLETARQLQTSLNPLALAVTARYGVPGLKAALRLQGRSAGYPRAPLLDVDEEAQRDLGDLLKLL